MLVTTGKIWRRSDQTAERALRRGCARRGHALILLSAARRLSCAHISSFRRVDAAVRSAPASMRDDLFQNLVCGWWQAAGAAPESPAHSRNHLRRQGHFALGESCRVYAEPRPAMPAAPSTRISDELPPLAAISRPRSRSFRSGATRIKDAGRIAIGLGLMLLALHILLDTLAPAKHAVGVRALLDAITGDPILCVLLAAALTWAAHSSVATVLLVMSLAYSQFVSPASAIPSGVQVWLATGHTDMRKGFDGLALLVQETLKRNLCHPGPAKSCG